MTLPEGDDDAALRDPLVGTVVAHTYRVIRRLADGGMATIYEAEHLRIRKVVALKVLRGASAGDPHVVARFRTEARAASAIGHPNIVDVSDFGACEDKSPFLVMERLVGEGLDDVIVRDQRLSTGRAVRIARQIAAALVAAHGKGVVHRDLKPANVFLVERVGVPEFVKLLDFGVSRFLDGTEGDPRLTSDGFALGTPRYMAPEQAEGSLAVDGRADIHALGAVLFRMLTGRDAFPGASIAETLFNVLCRTPPNVREFRPDVPARLGEVVAQMLQKKPAARIQTAKEVVEALVPFLALDAPPSAEIALPDPPPQPTTRRARRPNRNSTIPPDPEVSGVESRGGIEAIFDRDARR